MSRPQQIREVFSELRAALGQRIAPGEALECAAMLVDLFAEDDDGMHFSLRTGGVPFEMRALDVAFADGGWRVLCQEWSGLGIEMTDGCGGRGFPADLSVN
jgi:hypothetical protein